MIETISLRARVVDSSHFIFCPEIWVEQLKPYKSATWERVGSDNPHHLAYRIKHGNFIIFTQMSVRNGGFYIVHLYQIVKNSDADQMEAELTKDGLILKSVNGLVSTTQLKPQGGGMKDTPYHASLNLEPLYK